MKFLFKIIVFTTSVLLSHTLILAQADAELVAEADEAYKIGAKLLALDNYELALRSNPKNIRALYMTGKCILETADKGRAAQYLLKAQQLDANVDKDILYLVAQSYQYGREYDKAIDYYQQYKKKLISEGVKPVKKKKNTNPQDDILATIEQKIEQCNNGKKYISDPLEYSIQNFGEEINSEFPDYAPAVNKDETLIIFTSRREGGTKDKNGEENVDNDLLPFEDVYFSERLDGKWQPAKNIGLPINHTFHDASITISGDGTELFLYNDNNGNGDVFFSKRQADGTWTNPESLGKNINSSFDENSACLSPDGKTLFFTSNRPGGKGGLDIYVSKLEKNGEWGKPANLGSPINTELNEDGPFIDYDGKTLYFSSQGNKGMGGYDIFVTEYDSTSKKWKEPINIGYPINTSDDDTYFVKSGDTKFGYYASIKDGGLGEKDIYKVLIPEPLQTYEKLKIRLTEGPPKNPVVIKVPTEDPEKPKTETLYPVTLLINIRNEKTKEPLDAKIRISDKENNVEVGITRRAVGIYQVIFRNEKEKTYAITVENEGSMFKNEDLEIPAMATTEKKILKEYELSKIEVGFKTVLRNIYFDFNQASFKMESYQELSKLERMLKENTTIKVEISGHTDNVGSDAYNMELSQRRANAVVNWLVKKGVDRSRLIAKGYGESKPLATNDDEEEGRSINRRTEFEVISDLTSDK
jgi:outer membrane protein OmpA-like peptidoglycan-associated protein